jgi:hypothetical protein
MMGRPVARIEPMLAALRAVWLAHPDWRLGQVVGNAARDPEQDNGFGYGEYRDPFNVEDDQVWDGLRRLAGNPNG